MFDNIEWNMAGLVGMAMILNKPTIVDKEHLPKSIDVDGLVLKAPEILGLVLPDFERKARGQEFLALAQRCLICESTELAADVLFRASRLASKKPDPYHATVPFSVKFSDLWNPNRGMSGALLTPEQRNFMQECAVNLRGLIRHNNAHLLQNKSVIYKGTPVNKQIEVIQKWAPGSDNRLDISLDTSYEIFRSVAALVHDGIEGVLS